MSITLFYCKISKEFPCRVHLPISPPCASMQANTYLWFLISFKECNYCNQEWAGEARPGEVGGSGCTGDMVRAAAGAGTRRKRCCTAGQKRRNHGSCRCCRSRFWGESGQGQEQQPCISLLSAVTWEGGVWGKLDGKDNSVGCGELVKGSTGESTARVVHTASDPPLW